MRFSSRSCHAGVQVFRPVRPLCQVVIVLLKTAAFALYQKRKKIGIHFIISFQYSINILVITVKAGWVFFYLWRYIEKMHFFLNMLWLFFKKTNCSVRISWLIQAASDSATPDTPTAIAWWPSRGLSLPSSNKTTLFNGCLFPSYLDYKVFSSCSTCLPLCHAFWSLKRSTVGLCITGGFQSGKCNEPTPASSVMTVSLTLHYNQTSIILPYLWMGEGGGGSCDSLYVIMHISKPSTLPPLHPRQPVFFSFLFFFCSVVHQWNCSAWLVNAGSSIAQKYGALCAPSVRTG